MIKIIDTKYWCRESGKRTLKQKRKKKKKFYCQPSDTFDTIFENKCTAWKVSKKRSFSWSVFYRIRTEYGEILRISAYSVQMWENTDQKKLRIWTHFTQWWFWKRFLNCWKDSWKIFLKRFLKFLLLLLVGRPHLHLVIFLNPLPTSLIYYIILEFKQFIS